MDSVHKLIGVLTRRTQGRIEVERSVQLAAKCACGDTTYAASTKDRRSVIYARAWAENGRQSVTSAGTVQNNFMTSTRLQMASRHHF